MTGLHATAVGESGPWVVFCHGLFGQGRNWTGVATALAGPDERSAHRSLLVDMAQHGRSPWSEEFDYLAMADQLADTVGGLGAGPVAVVGHSMGGKVAMLLALRHPDLVERLCVVDISPVGTDSRDGFTPYVEAMRGVDLAGLTRRAEADEQMAGGVPDPVVRGFLLQNLRHDSASAGDGTWRWQMNLDVLGDQLDVIGGWPDPGAATYDGPVLWVAGQHSDHVRPDHYDTMAALFSRVQRITVKNAGHWVHSEQPEVFVQVLRRFLDAGADPAQPRE